MGIKEKENIYHDNKFQQMRILRKKQIIDKKINKNVEICHKAFLVLVIIGETKMKEVFL